MFVENLEIRDELKTNAGLKDIIDRFMNCSGEIPILPDNVCKCNKEKTRKEHFYLLNRVLKGLVII